MQATKHLESLERFIKRRYRAYNASDICRCIQKIDIHLSEVGWQPDSSITPENLTLFSVVFEIALKNREILCDASIVQIARASFYFVLSYAGCETGYPAKLFYDKKEDVDEFWKNVIKLSNACSHALLRLHKNKRAFLRENNKIFE